MYDMVHSLSSPVASSTDKLTAVDITILREVARHSGVGVRWVPGCVQSADGLTKDKEEPVLRLKGVLREGALQMSEEGETLRQNKLEKERKQRLRETHSEHNKKVTEERKSAIKTSYQIENKMKKVVAP